MRTLQRWPLLALTSLVFFAASACGGSSGHGTADVSSAPGASGKNKVNAAGAISATSAASGGNQAGGTSGTSTTNGGNQANGTGGAPKSSAKGGGQGNGAGQSNGGGGAPGAPGGNSGDQNQTAPGAPITIPNLIQGAGAPIDAAVNSLKTGESLPTDDITYDGIIHQCGGTLCVNIVVQEASGPTPVLGAGGPPVDPADPNTTFTQCQLMNMEPGPNAEVARGSTIVLVTGIKPCGSSASDSTGSPADTAPAP